MDGSWDRSPVAGDCQDLQSSWNCACLQAQWPRGTEASSQTTSGSAAWIFYVCLLTHEWAPRSFDIGCWWQNQAGPVAESSGISNSFGVCSRNHSWCVSCLDMTLCSLYGFPRSWAVLSFHSLLRGSLNCTKSFLSFNGCQAVVIEVDISNGHLIQPYYRCPDCIPSAWLYILLILNRKRFIPVNISIITCLSHTYLAIFLRSK